MSLISDSLERAHCRQNVGESTFNRPFSHYKEPGFQPPSIQEAFLMCRNVYSHFTLRLNQCFSWNKWRIQHIYKKDRVVVSTHNWGKVEDIPKYTALRINPLEVKEDTKEKISESNYFKFEQKPLFLAPNFISDGKCHGAVVTFLRDVLTVGIITGADIKPVAEKFEGGVPLEASLHQELYGYHHSELNLNKILAFVENCFETKPGTEASRLENFLTDKAQANSVGIHPASAHEIHIALAFLNFLQEGNNLSANGKELSAYVAQHLQTYNEELTPHERLTIGLVADFDEVEHEREAASFRIHGLEEEACIVETKLASTVLRAVDDLGLGAYKITLPFHNSQGIITGTHTIALVIGKSATYFYDPNSGIVDIQDRHFTLKEYLREECGYSEKPLTRIDRIWNRVIGRSNPSSDPIDLPLYTLRKVRLSEHAIRV